MDKCSVDTLLEARWIIPVETEGVLTEHAIAINNGLIEAILPSNEANSRYYSSNHIKLNNHAVIPGLINLHTHAAMTLMRGMADDLSLMSWLKNYIWPTESKYVDHGFVRDGTMLACAEMLKGGITCFNDMYFFPQTTADVALECGIRAGIGLVVIDMLSAYASDADDYIDKGLAVRDHYSQRPLLTFCLAPHAPYSVNDQTLTKIMVLAEQLQLPVHMHLHETGDEIKNNLTEHGIRPLTRLHQLGLVSPNLIAAHMIHLNDSEIELFHECGGHVAHCPSSNLKLASGIAPIEKLLRKGINIGIGTDGAASNNRLDMFSEMRLTALLAKGVSHNAEIVTSHQALQMATLNSAKAMGLDHITGSLSPGKAADITAVDFSSLSLSPCFDPISHLVYVAGREQVSHVWVHGRLLLDEGKLTTLDETAIMQQVKYWQQHLVS
ncbi:MAG: TRZ/ATZ family hydrolase [Nitrosomonas sp.]|nr:TRZ/ATZ family hydrolase [Nitrosomonas sp.]